MWSTAPSLSSSQGTVNVGFSSRLRRLDGFAGCRGGAPLLAGPCSRPSEQERGHHRHARCNDGAGQGGRLQPLREGLPGGIEQLARERVGKLLPRGDGAAERVARSFGDLRWDTVWDPIRYLATVRRCRCCRESRSRARRRARSRSPRSPLPPRPAGVAQFESRASASPDLCKQPESANCAAGLMADEGRRGAGARRVGLDC
jgi:hypothetical protein